MELEKYDEAVRDFEQINKMERGNQEYRQLLSNAKLELKKSKRKDYYKILGVDRSANDEEIKKAYRKRALVHHPGNLRHFTTVHIGAFYQIFVQLSSATSFEPISGNIDVLLG